MQQDKVTIQAEDAVCGNPEEGEQDMAYYCLMIRDEYDQINGLLRSLDAAVGAVYIVSCNLSMVDGLINGAVCTMKHIDYRNSKNGNIPSTLWVQFEDEQVEQLHRQKYKHYYGDGINNTWTPIFTQHRETTVCQCGAVRAQFPLIPTAAVTIHFEMLLLTWMYLLLHIMLKIWKQQKTFINMLIMVQQAMCLQFQGCKL